MRKFVVFVLAGNLLTTGIGNRYRDGVNARGVGNPYPYPDIPFPQYLMGSQALAQAPVGARFLSPWINRARFSALRSFGEALQDSESVYFPGDVPRAELELAKEKYDAELVHNRRALADLVAEKKDFVVPDVSIAKRVFQPHSQVPVDLNGGLLVGSLPSDPMAEKMTRVQNRFKDLLQKIVPRDHYDDLVEECLIFLKPETFHLTFAMLGSGPNFYPGSAEFKDGLTWAKERSEEVAKFRRTFDFEFNGDVCFLPERTSCIAAILNPASVLDLNRFHSVKSAFGATLPLRTDLAHVTFAYLRGKEDPATGKWIVTAQQLAWIQQALTELESELKGGTASRWHVNQLDVTGARNFGGLERLEYARLLEPAAYEGYVQKGKERALQPFNLRGMQDLDPRFEASHGILAQFDALRGLFRHRNLRNLSALWAAIGMNEISIQKVVALIQDTRKLGVRLVVEGGKAKLRVTAQYDHPGLLVALSRAIDWSSGFVMQMEASDPDPHLDPPKTKLVVMLTLRDMYGDFTNLMSAIQQVPDVGDTLPLKERILYLIPPMSGRREKIETVYIHARFPSVPQRREGEESRRTRALQDLIYIDPHCNITDFSLVREESSGPDILMAVQVPSRLAGRIASELATAVGVPQEFVTRVSVETYQHLRAAGTHRAPLTILPRHMGLAEFSDIGRYAEDLNLFRDWVVGKKVPEAIALWLGRMVVWSSRRSRRARPDEEAQQILQIKDWFNKRGFNPDLQENPELRGSPPAPAHVILDLDEGTEKERRLAFEVIDSANQQPSGGHYLRWSEEGAKPVFLIQLQSRYIREGKLDDVLENAMAQTEEDALRISREHVSAQVGLFAPRVLRDEWRLSRSS